jgi:curved DNA-binding protein CbpA
VSESRNPYEVLGVPRDATQRQIRSAYVDKARYAHPDIVGRRGLDLMRALNDAWDILKDHGRRSAWNAANPDPNAAPADRTAAAGEASGKPFWYGAHGPAPGRPFGPVLDFGIFEGWSIGEIARRDRGYLAWLQDRPEAAAIRGDIAKLLDPNAEEPAEPRGGRRRR